MFNRQNARDKKPLPKSIGLIAIMLIVIFSIVPTKYARQRQHLKKVEAYAHSVWLEQNPEAKQFFNHTR